MSLHFTEEDLAGFPPAARAIIHALMQRIAELEAELNLLRKTPQNSSLPPSTQHPHARPAPQKPKSKKKRGGQPGHARHARPLIPAAECDTVLPVKPTECRGCHAPLWGEDPQPLRQQVWELPEIKPIVTEYQQHRLTCPGCGQTTCGQLPPGVSAGQSGPRLVAFVGLLMANFRQSKRRTAMFVQTVLNIPCCPSLTVKMQRQVTTAARPAYDELVAQLPREEQLFIDESPTRQAKSKAWLWGVVAPHYTAFALRTTRGAVVLDELLTDKFSGIVNCDRAKMYWQCGRLQWCWAHVKRDFQALIDHADRQVKRLGHDLMRPTRAMFSAWARYRDGTITWRGFQRLMRPIRKAIDNLLLRGVFSGNSRLTGMCGELYQHRQWLWTFLEHQGLELTNNAAERALRHGVIWRKLSFGTQSAAGSRFVETALTVIETCRQQGRNVFEFLAAAVRNHFGNQPCPSLLSGV